MTTTEQLAAALRALHHQCEYMDAPANHPDMQAATEALARYDAEQAAATQPRPDYSRPVRLNNGA